MPPPKIVLIGVDKRPITANTLPTVGLSLPEESLPVVLATGVRPIRRYITIPQFDNTSSDKVTATIILISADNPLRRYIKIINNGGNDVEIWTGQKPEIIEIGQTPNQGEILFADGGGLLETDTCRLSGIWATCSTGTSGLMVLEG